MESMTRRAALTTSTMLVGVLAMMLVAFTGDAIAKSGTFVISPTRTEEFRVKGSGGYSISVFANHGKVSITAERGGSSATYIAHGITSPEQIQAQFGALGSVSVRFHPRERPRLVPLSPGNCQGRGEVIERGVFVGTIQFEGEQAYTTVNLSRGRGAVTRSLKQTCRNESGGAVHNSSVGLTFLSATSGSDQVVLSASRFVFKSQPRLNGSGFAGSISESVPGPVAVFRSITARADLDAFGTKRSAGEVAFATITPPVPFAGVGIYEKRKDMPAVWSGSLTGVFLGRGEVSLTGPQFTAEFLSE